MARRRQAERLKKQAAKREEEAEKEQILTALGRAKLIAKELSVGMKGVLMVVVEVGPGRFGIKAIRKGPGENWQIPGNAVASYRDGEDWD